MRLVQLAVPSRAEIDSYAEIRAQVQELVGRVNGKFGTAVWTPIHYLYRSLTPHHVVALYRAADVMLVTPLRDGMNLVAKEFVASRDDEDGVLILSEFAGAAAELGTALLVNPYDVDGVAEAMNTALRMPRGERRSRMVDLRRRVLTHDVHVWAEHFIDALTEIARKAEARPPPPLGLAPLMLRLGAAAHDASGLVLLLDYDGTLVPAASTPQLAAPDEDLLALLAALAQRPRTQVHVVSGRSREVLESWLGALPIGLHAEHGFWSRAERGAEWTARGTLSDEWKRKIAPILAEFAARTPGSFVEEKSSSLAWHYRLAEAEFGMLAGARAPRSPRQRVQQRAGRDAQRGQGRRGSGARNSEGARRRVARDGERSVRARDGERRDGRRPLRGAPRDRDYGSHRARHHPGALPNFEHGAGEPSPPERAMKAPLKSREPRMPRELRQPSLRTRASGVLLHPTCLPGPHGSGDIGESARRFVDFLSAASQRWWQMLPVGPPGYGESPYSAESAFAGNPFLVSLDELAVDGLLDPRSLAPASPLRADRMEFVPMAAHRGAHLRAAFAAFSARPDRELLAFRTFRDENAGWLDDFALFRALKGAHGGAQWTKWDPGVRAREPRALDAARKELAPAIALERFVQYVFDRQWTALRAYAAARGVGFIGDLPIFVAHDSADVSAKPGCVLSRSRRRACASSPVSPRLLQRDEASGGNAAPYRWEPNEEDRVHAWCIASLSASQLRRFDVIRLDHFIGFERYWKIPASEPTAIRGRWMKGPGADFFDAVERALGHLPLIAEDLGEVTPCVDSRLRALPAPRDSNSPVRIRERQDGAELS